MDVDSDGGKRKEKMHLPFQSSSYVSNLLYGACQELHKLAAHNSDRVRL